MNLIEKTLSQKICFEGKIITVRQDTVELPNVATSTREVVEHPGGVCVLALDEADNLYLVEQFRYPYGSALLEIPAGKREKGEPPLLTAVRELEEETGLRAEHYTDLGQMYPTPGYCGEIIYIYLATGLTQGKGNLDADEFLNVKKLPLAQAAAMVMDNTIKDAKTQIAILKVLQNRSKGVTYGK